MVSPEILRRFDCFGGVSEAVMAAVARIGEVQSYNEGEKVFLEGMRPDFLYMIIDGQVDIHVDGGRGRKVVVDSVGPGDLALWSAVVSPNITTATGIARCPTLLVALRATELRQLVEREHTLGFRLMHAVCRSLSERLSGAFLQLAGEE
jgi:thioredoxin reductase (NADPH)